MLAQFSLTPQQASTVAPAVDQLALFIMGTTAAISTVTAVVLIYFTIHYRRRGDEIPKPIEGSAILEATWSLIPLAIVLVMFAWSVKLFFVMAVPPSDAIDVYVVGKQWMWKCQHPTGQREINELHVPVGQPVRLLLTSEDVIHSFAIPDFRMKQDAVPGRYTQMWFEATKPGRYRLFCAEYCGKDHALMGGWVVASDPAEHQKWLSEKADLSLALRGRQRFLQAQCITCHSNDAKAQGPILENIYRQQVRLADGRTIVADEAYLRESILNPRAKVVAGFEPIMPPYQGQLTEDELLELIAYIKSLRQGETPKRNEFTEPPAVDPKKEAKP